MSVLLSIDELSLEKRFKRQKDKTMCKFHELHAFQYQDAYFRPAVSRKDVSVMEQGQVSMEWGSKSCSNAGICSTDNVQH